MPKVVKPSKQIVQKTIEILNKLPHDKAVEVADFADFILSRLDGQILQKGIEKLSADSLTFDFLNDEDEIYTLKDAKVIYHGKR
jgi:hypothetical protein